ncbi:hypothetical protein [Neobacillus sp. 114]|uniref:hypothetical protein n=1 Tax=Neobacillus sp. 114 TaxID=3048535 RepID=UPI0024C2B6D5|nr:hypothetical protein [Neobacillus sp. 114]
MEKFQTNIYLNMPDLHFSRFCEEEYKVNRGIYNTIEQWFYNQGVHNIINRREVILNFFLFVRTSQNSNKKIKFGHGGLTDLLNRFWCEYKVAQ